MKKNKMLLCLVICAVMVLGSNYVVSNAYDFTSNHITIKSDANATQEKQHPVLMLTNNTNSDLNVTYDFYIHKTDTMEYSENILIKANESVQLELPQLHHLGDTQETRTIWFSWSERSNLKPLQTQVETSIFANPIAPPQLELGLNQ